MALDQDVQLAATLVQAIGLILPVVFIALRPYYAEAVDEPTTGISQSNGQSEDVQSPETLIKDDAPGAVGIGIWAAGALGVAGVFATMRLILATSDLLVIGAAGGLGVGLLLLVLLILEIRNEFVTEIEVF